MGGDPELWKGVLAGWRLPCLWGAGGAMRPFVQVLKRPQTDTNSHYQNEILLLGWSSEKCCWVRLIREGVTLEEVLLLTPQALQSPSGASTSRTQQGAAGKADIWFRESQFCITKQNIKGLVGDWQTTLVTGPVVRLMKHRRGVPKAAEIWQTSTTKRWAVTESVNSTQRMGSWGTLGHQLKMLWKVKQLLEAEGTHSSSKKWHLTTERRQEWKT